MHDGFRIFRVRVDDRRRLYRIGIRRIELTGGAARVRDRRHDRVRHVLLERCQLVDRETVPIQLDRIDSDLPLMKSCFAFTPFLSFK